jgi:hypothetical protein
MPPDKKHARRVAGRANSLELLPSSELTTEDAIDQLRVLELVQEIATHSFEVASEIAETGNNQDWRKVAPPLHFHQGCAVLAFLQRPNLSSFLAAFPHFDSQQTFPRVRKSYE